MNHIQSGTKKCLGESGDKKQSQHLDLGEVSKLLLDMGFKR